MTPRVRARLALCVRGMVWASTILLVGALAAWFTVRDGRTGVQLLFYGAPRPVLALLALIPAVYWWKCGSRIVAAPFLAVAIGALGVWWMREWKWATPLSLRGELRVVQWNVDRPVWRLETDARWLRAQDADVITIADRQPRKKDQSARWRAEFPDYQPVFSRGEMLCFVRGEVLSVEEGMLAPYSFRTLIRTRIRGRELTVLQVDLEAKPRISRREPWRRLVELTGTLRDQPLLIAGDFNTPLESVFVPPLRAEATNAFEAAGRGCAATWPMPLSVLSLDQIWANRRLRAVRCEHAGSWRSDHRAVVADFDFVP